eukprot:GHVU01156792.1.p3 GENE.GHVU01156792.1~~GHVU01156792.1.p3  ORF type:complete len:128 (-),score=2.43 GHVU01156792.1:244-627(-)
MLMDDDTKANTASPQCRTHPMHRYLPSYTQACVQCPVNVASHTHIHTSTQTRLQTCRHLSRLFSPSTGLEHAAARRYRFYGYDNTTPNAVTTPSLLCICTLQASMRIHTHRHACVDAHAHTHASIRI